MRDLSAHGRALLEIGLAHLPADAATRWSEAAPAPGKPLQRGLFFGHFAGVGRRTRDLPFALSAGERATLRELGVSKPDPWRLSDVIRAGFLCLACSALEPREHFGLVHEAFAKGDNSERVAVLRTLPILNEPRRYLDIAAEACRTNVRDVFEAVACDNDFPYLYFPDSSFNQLVIKAMFLDLPLARVHGLKQRKNPELYRMARDYEAERRAAGRPISDDLAYLAHALENDA